MGGHLVVKARPLSIAGVKFLIGGFIRFRPPSCLGGETFQLARPAAVCFVGAIKMQAGKLWVTP